MDRYMFLAQNNEAICLEGYQALKRVGISASNSMFNNVKDIPSNETDTTSSDQLDEDFKA